MDVFRGKRALVTGASSGIGAAMALQLAAAGCDLILVARRSGRLHEMALRCSEAGAAHGIECEVIAMDLLAHDAAHTLHRQLRELDLPVDILINNAGFGFQQPLLALPLNDHLRMIDLNVRTLTALTHLFAADMVGRGQGWILQVGSVAGYLPIPGMATYAATKAYVVSLGRALAEELRPQGVVVSTLAPGGTETEFSEVAGQRIEGYKKAALMSAERVARDGLHGLARGRVVVVPGMLYKSSVGGARLLPERWLTRLAGRVMKD